VLIQVLVLANIASVWSWNQFLDGTWSMCSICSAVFNYFT